MSLPSNHNTEARLTALEVRQQVLIENMSSMGKQLEQLNKTVSRIQAGLHLGRWFVTVAIGLGPVLGVILSKYLEGR